MMKVAVFTNSFSRHGGGLFWAVRALNQSLQEEGCALRVYAPKDEVTADDLLSWGSLEIVALPVFGPSAFSYLPGLQSALNTFNPNLLHVNGMWKHEAVATLKWARQTSRPYIVSPHGMLDNWALSHSAWKKRIASALYQKKFIRQANCIHALSISEMQSIRALGLTNPIAILPNGVDLPDRLLSKPIPKWAEGFPSEKKILLFLGRLHPKKGLVHLIRGWAMARRGNSDASATWLLVIAGWDQRGHQAEIESLVDGLGVNDSVFFVGPQFNEDKITSFNRADAFVLPSFSEGLPMAVLEAWAYRLPVIMTPQCNLPEGFSSGAAIPVDADADSIYEGLSNLFIMDSSALASMGERGRKLVETNFAWPRIAANMYSVYQWLLDKNEKPQCVKLVTNL